jgi:hypothetical protein
VRDDIPRRRTFQLVGVDLPNDAVGATRAVTGNIAFDAAGRVVPASSKFVIDAGR